MIESFVSLVSSLRVLLILFSPFPSFSDVISALLRVVLSFMKSTMLTISKKKSELFSLKNCCIQTYDFDKFDKRIAHYTFSKFNSPHKYFLSTYLTEISATNEAH